MGADSKSLLNMLKSPHSSAKVKTQESTKIYKRLKQTEGDSLCEPLQKEQQITLLKGLQQVESQNLHSHYSSFSKDVGAKALQS